MTTIWITVATEKDDDDRLREAQELDDAYAGAAAYDDLMAALWREWCNMTGLDDDEDWDEYVELRKAALNHRGQP